MRDWASLIAVSDDGRTVLKKLGQVRIDLLQLENDIRTGRHAEAATRLAALRTHLQLFGLALELISSPRFVRPGILARSTGGSPSYKAIGSPFQAMLDLHSPNIRTVVTMLDAQRSLSLAVRTT